MSPIEICQYLDWRILVAMFVADKVLEAWLGKTKTVESGSVLELIWKVVKTIFHKN